MPQQRAPVATPRVAGIHIHLQHMEIAVERAAQQVAGDAAIRAVDDPQLATLQSCLQREQIQTMTGEHRVRLVPAQ
ncbi:hypothetical protein D3C73_1405980 [compost metagenome]